MLRLLRNLPRIANLDDFSAIHHRDASREIAHHRHGMRDKEISQTELPLQLRQQIHNLRPHADVERRNRLIGHNKFRTQGESARDPDALPLSPAELMRKPGQHRLVEADGAEQFGNASPARRQTHRLVNHQRFADDIFHIHAGIKRPERVLKNDLHVAAQAAHLTVAGRKQVAAFKAHAAGSRLDQPQHQAAQSAFSRSRFADQAESFAGVNVERNIVHGADFSFSASPEHRLAQGENFRQIANLNERHKRMWRERPARAAGVADAAARAGRSRLHDPKNQACTGAGLLAINWRSTNCRMPPLA